MTTCGPHERSAREPIDTRSPDPQAHGDRRWPHALIAEALDSFSIDRGRSPLIDPPGLSSGYPLELPLAAKVRLELDEHPKHVEERLAGRCRGITRLFSWLEGR